MPRIKPVKPDSTDTRTAETLASVKAKLGMLPNLFTTLAQSPAALNSYLYLTEAVTTGHLTSKQRELIAIAVAQENECEYCLSAHTAIAKGLGLNDEAIKHARAGAATHSLDNAIVVFAIKMVRSRGGVSDADFMAIRKAGGDDSFIIEIAMNVVLNILTNYVNRLADTDVDFPVVSLASVA